MMKGWKKKKERGRLGREKKWRKTNESRLCLEDEDEERRRRKKKGKNRFVLFKLAGIADKNVKMT